jgi:hypothetical protein
VTAYDGAELAAMVTRKVEGAFFQFDVAVALRNGVNDLRVRLCRSGGDTPPRPAPTTLVEVRLDLDYA